MNHQEKYAEVYPVTRTPKAKPGDCPYRIQTLDAGPGRYARPYRVKCADYFGRFATCENCSARREG